MSAREWVILDTWTAELKIFDFYAVNDRDAEYIIRMSLWIEGASVEEIDRYEVLSEL